MSNFGFVVSVAEILSLFIKNKKEIKGIKMSNIKRDVKNIQHADDVTLALNDLWSLNIAVKTVEEFCKSDGSKVNLSKTQCMHLGSLKVKTSVGGINVTNDAVRC